MFSIFDPVSILGLPMNMVAFMLVLVVFPAKYWLVGPKQYKGFNVMLFQVQGDFKAALQPFTGPGSLLITSGLFIIICINNFVSLFPYIFSSAAHGVCVLTLALPLWVGYMLSYMAATPSYLLAHFLPLGTPLALWPLMILIEIVSAIIRPVTLSVRLMANMIAGHLLLALVGGQLNLDNKASLLVLSIAGVALVVLELAVSVIQSYVFSLLSTLYVSEANTKKLHDTKPVGG